MPSFEESTTTEAPLEEVWKLLYDPTRFPDWWVGVETVEPDRDRAGGQAPDQGYTMYPTGYPDFPMPQTLRSDHAHGRVEISCQVSDLTFAWRLSPGADGTSTQISVHVDVPDAEAQRLATQADVIHRSLARLAALARECGT